MRDLAETMRRLALKIDSLLSIQPFIDLGSRAL
jgi:hypothetical protein